MRKAIDDLKSCITLLFAFALIVLLFVAVFKSDSMFETVFLLFTNICTSVFTFFFSKKKDTTEGNTNEWVR